ncbi:HDOD domain-containing protein [Candidatus Latescibacterota bacterium]
MVDYKNGKEKNEFNNLIEKVNNSDISSIKEVLMQIIKITNDPKSCAIDLKNVIEKDPPLSARLLKLANSSYYGLHRRIFEIQEAIICIGFNAVKELALNQKICELFKKNVFFEGYSRNALWENSIAVALCCKLLYMVKFKNPGENIYLAGLLHNIGIILEDQFMQDKFKDVLMQSKKDKCNLSQAEINILGFNHEDIGMAIAYNWNFPDELVIPIGNHHKPDVVDDKYKKIVMTLYISDFICQMNNIGYCDASYENQSLYTRSLKELKIQEESMNLIIKEVQNETQIMKKNKWF